jgi:hypothetical protein
MVLGLIYGPPWTWIQETALKPLIVTTVDGRGRSKEVLHIEKHEAVCDLCGSLIALSKKGTREEG